MRIMTINILGSKWTIEEKKYSEDPVFGKSNCNGYCDWATREIVFCEMSTYPGYEDESKAHCAEEERLALRHEIVHAYFDESGLMANAHRSERSVAQDEEIVDWIAIQWPKIYRTWEEAGCLSR